MIYIHVPFCHRKCTYCAFFSKVESGEWKVERYVDSLLEEMERRKGEQAHAIQTVYFGGGTPSILSLGQLSRIVEGLRRCFDLSQVQEVTLEANPEDLTPDYLRGLASLRFFNRLSIGIQSLDDDMLRLLNRRHSAQQAVDAVENAQAAGFHNISVDFIYGLPVGHRGQAPFPGGGTGASPLSKGVTHVSAYALTVEEGTALSVQVKRGRVVLPDEEEVVRQYHELRLRLMDAGFEQYEVSNYARAGYRSRHNSRYWNRTPYLGLGPGAHSFSFFESGSTSVAHVEKRRWNNPDGTVGEETLTDKDAFNEIVMTALRTTDGLALSVVPEGQRERLHRMMQPYIDCGWIIPTDNRYVPTAEGLLHADGIAASLFVA